MREAMDFMIKGRMLAGTTAALSAIDVVFGGGRPVTEWSRKVVISTGFWLFVGVLVSYSLSGGKLFEMFLGKSAAQYATQVMFAAIAVLIVVAGFQAIRGTRRG